MSVKINFNGISLISPGSYSTLNTNLLTNTQLGESGIVGIVGEADGGQPNVLDVISAGQFQSAKERYKSGPIAKALQLLANPSTDPNIPGGASQVIVYKTNNSTQATKNLINSLSGATAIIALTSENYGVAENNINIKIAEGDIADAQASLTGTEEGDYTFSGSDTLIVNVNGTDYTYTSSLGSGSQTIDDVIDDLNDASNWAASKPITASKVTTGGSEYIKIEITDGTDTTDLEYGILSVDATSDLETVLGFSTDAVRGIKGNRIITENKGTDTNVSASIGGEEMISIEYTGAGTGCALSIQDVSGVKTLTTTATGAAADDLSIDLTGVTLKELADQINAQANYTCSSSFFNRDSVVAANVLDYYNAIDCKTLPVVLYNTVVAVVDHINANSSMFTAEIQEDVIGQIETIATAEFFTGGTKGISTNTNFQNGFDALKEVRVNTVVPLISEDGVGSSTYTVDSVNAQANSHADFMSGITGRSERNVFVAKKGTKTEVIAAARAINTRHVSLTSQRVTALNELGTLEKLDEWALSCILAGMQAGTPVGEPLTHKSLNIVALEQDATWNPKVDFVDMMDNGVLIIEQADSGQYRVANANTTYSKDGNVVFNRISINEAANYVAYELRKHLELLFVGKKARTGTVEAIKNAAISKLQQLQDEEIIVEGNQENGEIIPAFRNLQVSFSGTTCSVEATITPVPGIDFVLNTIYLTSLEASTSA